MLVDSHCHLNFPDFKNDMEGVVERARKAGIGVMQTICTEMAEFEEVYAITERFEGVYCSVGVHPNDSEKAEQITAAELIAKTHLPNVIGIGETGLDYYYEKSNRDIQKRHFLAHIQAARETGLPVIIHTRNADEDTVEILSREMEKGAFTGVIHCFTSSQYLAEKAIDLGLYISASGIITFKNAQAIRQAIESVPLHRLLVETDAPFLAPMPHRGKRNEPAFVVNTNRILANIKNISEQACAALTSDNFFTLFSKSTAPKAAACV